MSYRYGGRRSKGCNLCRQRKVRCGEERPTCARCEKVGKECVYRDAVDLLFHDETAHASARAERMWLSRATQEASDDASPSSNASANSSRSGSLYLSSMPLQTKTLDQSLKDFAMSRFNYDFIIEQGNKLFPTGYLDYLPKVYAGSRPGSSVDIVFEAVALANLSRRFHVPSHVSALAASKYGAALRSTGEALRDPARMLNNETVMSCQLLGMYELIVPSTSSYSDWNNHSQGAITLLKLRGSGQLQDPAGLGLFKQIYASELISAVRYCQEPVSFLEMSKQVVSVPQFMIFSTLYDTSQATARFLELVERSHGYEPDIDGLQNILARAQQLQSRIHTLLTCLPPAFGFERCKRYECALSAPRWLQRVLRDKRGPEYAHLRYSNINMANCWNWIRHCQVRILQLQILVAAHLGADPELQMMKLWDIESLVDDMNSALVYFLACDEDGEFNMSTKIEDVRGIKTYFLMRSVVAARMALEFVSRRGVDVRDKLEWLADVCQLLKDDFGAEAPVGPDPMEIS